VESIRELKGNLTNFLRRLNDLLTACDRRQDCGRADVSWGGGTHLALALEAQDLILQPLDLQRPWRMPLLGMLLGSVVAFSQRLLALNLRGV
jgi:hypothetical protein